MRSQPHGRLDVDLAHAEILEEAQLRLRLTSAARLSTHRLGQESLDCLLSAIPPQSRDPHDVRPWPPRRRATVTCRETPQRPMGPQTLDTRTLARLVDELGDAEALARFVQVFLALLPGRLREIAESLHHPVAGTTTEASRNLIATSRMIGAEALVGHLQRVAEAGTAEAMSREERRALVIQSFDLVRDLRRELLRQVARLRAHQTEHHPTLRETAR